MYFDIRKLTSLRRPYRLIVITITIWSFLFNTVFNGIALCETKAGAFYLRPLSLGESARHIAGLEPLVTVTWAKAEFVRARDELARTPRPKDQYGSKSELDADEPIRQAWRAARDRLQQANARLQRILLAEKSDEWLILEAGRLGSVGMDDGVTLEYPYILEALQQRRANRQVENLPIDLQIILANIDADVAEADMKRVLYNPDYRWSDEEKGRRHAAAIAEMKAASNRMAALRLQKLDQARLDEGLAASSGRGLNLGAEILQGVNIGAAYVEKALVAAELDRRASLAEGATAETAAVTASASTPVPGVLMQRGRPLPNGNVVVAQGLLDEFDKASAAFDGLAADAPEAQTAVAIENLEGATHAIALACLKLEEDQVVDKLSGSTRRIDLPRTLKIGDRTISLEYNAEMAKAEQQARIAAKASLAPAEGAGASLAAGPAAAGIEAPVLAEPLNDIHLTRQGSTNKQLGKGEKCWVSAEMLLCLGAGVNAEDLARSGRMFVQSATAKFGGDDINKGDDIYMVVTDGGRITVQFPSYPQMSRTLSPGESIGLKAGYTQVRTEGAAGYGRGFIEGGISSKYTGLSESDVQQADMVIALTPEGDLLVVNKGDVRASTNYTTERYEAIPIAAAAPATPFTFRNMSFSAI